MFGAPSTRQLNWKLINWDSVQKHVRRLQMRIAKATKLGRFGKAKALQWLLTHSFFAKLLAIRRVTQNRGKNTPGVDRVIWKLKSERMQHLTTQNFRNTSAEGSPSRKDLNEKVAGQNNDFRKA